MKNSSYLNSKMKKFLENDEKNSYMLQIPPKKGRYIVLDTETTGLSSRADHVVEIAAHEIQNGKITGAQFHIYIKPRIIMTKSVIKIHKITNDFYDKNFGSLYESDKENMRNFIKFIGNSIIFAHNAPFDMTFINNELKHWNLPTINPQKYRCTMRIFCNLLNNIEPQSLAMCNLKKCCDYFNLEHVEDAFHNALYDSLMTAKLMCRMYELIEMNKNLKDNKNICYMSSSIDEFLTKTKRKNTELKLMIDEMNKENENIENDPEKKFAHLFRKNRKKLKCGQKFGTSPLSLSNNSSNQNKIIINENQFNNQYKITNFVKNNSNNNSLEKSSSKTNEKSDIKELSDQKESIDQILKDISKMDDNELRELFIK